MEDLPHVGGDEHLVRIERIDRRREQRPPASNTHWGERVRDPREQHAQLQLADAELPVGQTAHYPTPSHGPPMSRADRRKVEEPGEHHAAHLDSGPDPCLARAFNCDAFARYPKTSPTALQVHGGMDAGENLSDRP